MKNTDLIPEKTLTQLEELNKRLLVVNDGLATILETSSKFTNELLKSSASLKTIADAYKALANTTTDYNEKARKQMDIEAQKARIIRQIEQAQSAEGKELAVVRQRLNEANAANRVYAKETLAAANSIEAMRVKLSAMKKEWASLDVDSAQFKQLSADINKLNADISKHEQAIGVYGRNVGNYASGFSTLNYNIQQVVRELPSLTYGANVFFSAISNNLPMLVDDMNRAKEANAKLREEGKKTTPVWKQMVGGILSWQTALVVGITLLTAFGKEIGNWVKSLFTGKEAMDLMAKTQKIYNDSVSDGIKKGEQEIAKLKLLYGVTQNVNKSMEERNLAAAELQKMYPSYLSNLTKEQIIAGKASDIYASLSRNILDSAMAKAKYDKVVELSSNILDIENSDEYKQLQDYARKYRPEYDKLEAAGIDSGPIYRGIMARLRPVLVESKKITEQLIENLSLPDNVIDIGLENYVKSLKEARDKIANTINIKDLTSDISGSGEGAIDKLYKDANTKLNDILKEKSAIEELTLFEIKTRADAQKRIVENELRSYDERKRALDLYTNYLNKSVSLNADNQIEKLISDTMKETGVSRVQAEESLSAQIKLIRAKESNEIENILRESAATQIDIEKERVQGIIEQINIEQAIRNSEIDRNESNSLVDLSNQYAEGLIAQQEYEAKKTAIIRAAEEDRFAAQIAALKDTRDKLLDSESTSVEDMLAINKKIDDAQLEYHKWINQQILEDDQKTIAVQEQLAQKRDQLIKAVFDFASALMQNKTESDLEELDKQSEQNEEWAENERDRIDRLEEAGAISKEEADARKAAVDEQEETREKELENKKKEIQVRQAKFDKAMAIAQIGWSTAKAIIELWAKPGFPAAIPLVAMVSALGATQIATVLATPIPQYAEGTQDHPGGLAIVGDGGRSELVYSGGSFYKTPATDTLVDLPAHSVVMPDFDKALEEVALPTIPTKTKDIPDYVAKFDELNNNLWKLRNDVNKLASIYNRDKNNRRYEMILSRISHPKIRS